MRSVLVAFMVLGLAVALLSRTVSAEPPPAMEPRELGKIIEALRKKPLLKTELSSVLFAGEVLHLKSLQAPVGSSLETLGPWSDNNALLMAESVISTRHCGALTAEELKAAGAIVGEFGAALPVTLRAYALGQQGKKSEAAAMFASFIDKELPGECPGEHPMYSYRRVGRMEFALECLKVMAPGRDVSALQKKIERAQTCANTNRTVG